ncbi:MAG: hypothetical protein NZM11_04830 [Anaerolineales bacterium]|nr:hypothetical protein [Anaerolineales bacterium]
MDLTQLFKESWRITRTCWSLWVLSAALFLAFVPAALLAGGLGAASAALTLPYAGPEPEWLGALRSWPAWVWATLGIVAILFLIASTAVSYIAQAATIRGAALATERLQPVSLRETLQLGRPRLMRLLGLAGTVGAVISILTLIPVLLRLLMAQQAGLFGLMLVDMGQAVLSPVLSVLGLAVFLIVLAIAVEDVSARRAPRRAWAVFCKGWWAFLLVLFIAFLPSLAIVALVLPVGFILALMVLNTTVGVAVLLVYGAVVGPLGVALLLFVAVFSTTLYTLVYHAAARLADATGSPITT